MANDEPEGFSLYSLATGEIRMQVGAYRTALDNKREGEAILTGRWDDRHWYVVAGTLAQRPMLVERDTVDLPADGVTEFVIPNVPAGTQLRIGRSDPQTIDDGRFEFVTAFASVLRLELMPPFPFQHQTFRIIAYAV